MTEKKIMLLIVEDNEQIRELFRRTFIREPQVEVLEAKNGVDAFKKLQELQPDVVLSDVEMPGEIDGISLCQKIKSSANPCHVILISGHGQQRNVDMGMEAGADAYKVKPVNPIELIRIVKSFGDKD